METNQGGLDNSSQPSIKEPIDARIEVFVDGDHMKAMIQVFPPEYGGKPLTQDLILSALTAKEIHFGLDQSLLQRVLEEKLYQKMLIIARGQPAVDGQDGIVEELFPRQQSIHLVESEDGSIDFKDLNVYVSVEENQTLCLITPPTEPISGRNIHGHEVHGRRGKSPIIPRGEGTFLNESQTKLMAQRRGHLHFRQGKFCVDTVLTIPGNVDHSVGNLDFSGDVIILGDLLEGFTVKAEGDVTVKGAVEGAYIYAGGSITLAKGFNGMQKGRIEAGKDITGTFIENGIVLAGGTVCVESIIHSTVIAGNEIQVKGKRGVIVGGQCTALNRITAKAVGSRAGNPTMITLGATQSIIEERTSLKLQLKELESQYEEIEKTLQYLEGLQKKGHLPEARLEMYSRLRREKPLSQLKRSQLQKAIQSLEDKIHNLEECRLICDLLFPSVKIQIGSAHLTVLDLVERCVLFYNKGEIGTTRL